MPLPLKILFVCTHNRCRSILSEAVTKQLAAGQIEARSAGSAPAGEVHPLSLRYLRERGYATEGLRSQSWDAFEDWNPDVTITVCDKAAAEPCPLWMGQGLKVHWGLSDPSKLEGSEAELAAVFNASIDEIEARVRALLALPLQGLDAATLETSLRALTDDE